MPLSNGLMETEIITNQLMKEDKGAWCSAKDLFQWPDFKWK